MSNSLLSLLPSLWYRLLDPDVIIIVVMFGTTATAVYLRGFWVIAPAIDSCLIGPLYLQFVDLPRRMSFAIAHWLVFVVTILLLCTLQKSDSPSYEPLIINQII
jgi:hypothetical protein